MGLLDFAQGMSNAAASNVSGPVDIIAWLLRKAGAGKVIGDEPVGGSGWMRRHGLTAEAPGLAGLLGEGVGMSLPIAAAAPQIAGLLNAGGANLAAPRTLSPQTGAVVYHGSPHKFDKFDSSKIGTGEGSQAWGPGIYQAETEATAKTYIPPQGGYLYKSDLNDAAISKMLNADAAWQRQNSVVRDFWKRFLKEFEYSDAVEALSRAKNVSARDFGKTNSGNAIYEIMRHDMGEKELVKRMTEAGIPGIRYLDRGSRGSGTGTSNYVVFPGEEDALKILERNGAGLFGK